MSSAVAGFEGYRRRFVSWWDVQIEDLRSGMFLVSYKDTNDQAWLPLTQLRLRSRRADGWDCYLLKEGMDVSVLSKHPESDTFSLQKEALYDARITSVRRSNHAPGECSCKFAVQFFTLKMDTYVDEILLDRKLLTDIPEMEVTISNMRILQQPAETIPLHDILEAHLAKAWIPGDRGCKDAYFLIETDLSTPKRAKRVSVEDVTGPTNLRSDEVLSPSAARVSTKNADKESNCNSTADGREEVGLGGSRPSSETVEEEWRIPKSTSGAPLKNQKEKHSVGHPDQKCPPNKRQCVQGEKHQLLDKEMPTRKKGPGRPRKVRPEPTSEKVIMVPEPISEELEIPAPPSENVKVLEPISRKVKVPEPISEKVKKAPIRLNCRDSKTELVSGLKIDRRTNAYKGLRREAKDEMRCKVDKDKLSCIAEDKGDSTETSSSNDQSEWVPSSNAQSEWILQNKINVSGISAYVKNKHRNAQGRGDSKFKAPEQQVKDSRLYQTPQHFISSTGKKYSYPK